MEVIKKIIHRALTTLTVPCTGTTGTCHVIIPDLDAVYFMKLNLTSELMDIGFFDAFVEADAPPIPPDETYYLVDNDGDELWDDNDDIFIYE